MSLKAVPVCTNCRSLSELSIACTECFQICCVSCFKKRSDGNDIFNISSKNVDDSQARPCPKCIARGNSSELSAMEPDQNAFSSACTVPEFCKIHLEKCKFYCTQCHVAICALCVDEGQPHEQHHIDNYSIVYQDKVSEMNRKLDQVDSSAKCSAVYEWNLQMLEKEEAAVLKEIEALSESSKLKVTRMTSIRKERLRAKLQYPLQDGKIVTEARDMIRTSTMDEFMKSLSKLDQICTNLASSTSKHDFCLETADDIECDLVPAYNFGLFTSEGLFRTGNSECKFTLYASYDIDWYVTLLKSDQLQIKVSPNDPAILKFPHKLVVIIPHPNSEEEIRQTFEVKDNVSTFDVIQVSRLVLQGFQKDNNEDLEVKVGIRPVNAVVEKQLLTYRYEEEKDICTELTEKVDFNHQCMHYVMKMDNTTKYPTRSSCTTDESDREWRLNVYLNDDLGAYIELCKGSPAEISCFVELRHEDPMKTVVKTRESLHFDKLGRERGWKLMKKNELMEDEGFYRDGFLRFRFGVQLLPD
nr:uncharacterized protein LOC109405694 isoform X1 [Aedes albopictus]